MCCVQNELGVLEFIHALVETMDKYFESVVCHRLFVLSRCFACVFLVLRTRFLLLLCLGDRFVRSHLPVRVRCESASPARRIPKCAGCANVVVYVCMGVLQIMFNLEKAHFILDEMVMNGYIVETNKISILKPIHLMEKSS